MRAFMMMVLVATPSILLPGVGSDGKQMVALVALFAGVLTFVEYNATYPGLIEFRDAPPYNRTRFCMLFTILVFLTLMQCKSTTHSTLCTLVDAFGMLVGHAMDFPYSPVRLAKLMMADNVPHAQVLAVRDAAGVAYVISMMTLAVFLILLRLNKWPTHNGAFNVWVNLPTFDPTVGGDVVTRLDRDARINLALGFLLPFLLPAVVKFGGIGTESFDLQSPQTLIWVMSIWAFLPASLLMRGIAMFRIVGMIKARRDTERAGHDYIAA